MDEEIYLREITNRLDQSNLKDLQAQATYNEIESVIVSSAKEASIELGRKEKKLNEKILKLIEERIN